MIKGINTVCGTITGDQLGRTLVHEHFLYGYCGYSGDSTLGEIQEDYYLPVCLEACSDAQSYGIKTIVDTTTNECGRNPVFLKKLSEISGMQIICATGFYSEKESAYSYWRYRHHFTDIQREIREMMLTEITEGINGSGIRAGVIMLATGSDEITELEKQFIIAAAEVQKETGVVILTHTDQGCMGPEQAALLIEHGADPAKICIGHMCGSQDLSYHRKVLEQGVYISLDRFGLQGEALNLPTDEDRIQILLELIENGYEDRILFG